MSHTVAVAYQSKCTVTETNTDTHISSSNNSLTFGGLDTTLNLNSGTTPDVELHAAMRVTMTAGAATIDLRALTGSNGGAVDGNGKKVRILKLKAKSDNANPITIVDGASNGYPVFGDTSSSITLSASQEALFYFADAATAIDATHKTIDISGTGSQVLDVEVVLG